MAATATHCHPWRSRPSSDAITESRNRSNGVEHSRSARHHEARRRGPPLSHGVEDEAGSRADPHDFDDLLVCEVELAPR